MWSKEWETCFSDEWRKWEIGKQVKRNLVEHAKNTGVSFSSLHFRLVDNYYDLCGCEFVIGLFNFFDHKLTDFIFNFSFNIHFLNINFSFYFYFSFNIHFLNIQTEDASYLEEVLHKHAYTILGSSFFFFFPKKM